MSLVLASISLFGLCIFSPGITAGLVSGGPQLGAGAAVGTASALASGALLVAAPLGLQLASLAWTSQATCSRRQPTGRRRKASQSTSDW
jgi:type IV secretory pathway TrbL component